MYSFILEPLLKEETIKTKKNHNKIKAKIRPKMSKQYIYLKAEHKDKYTNIVVNFLLVPYISKYNLDPKEHTMNLRRISCEFLSVILLL